MILQSLFYSILGVLCPSVQFFKNFVILMQFSLLIIFTRENLLTKFSAFISVKFTTVSVTRHYTKLLESKAAFVLVTPLCYYYIVNGTVYQCPDLYTFIQSKLIGIVHPLRQALETARQFSR